MRRIIIAALFPAAVVLATFTISSLAASQQDYNDCSQTADIARGIAACTRVIEDQSQSAGDRAGAYVQRGNDYVASGKLDEAIADYSGAIQLDAKNVLAYAVRAIAYWRENDRDSAVADYKQAASIDAVNIREMTLPNPELKAIRQVAREGVCRLASADWATTESVATVAAYEDHIAQFAVCAYAAIAQQRIVALKQSGSLQTIGDVIHGYLGVQIGLVTPEIAAKLDLKVPRGTLVDSVEASGPALQAGVQKDDVIVAIDGMPIRGNDLEELPAMISGMKPGTQVKLTLIRSGAEKTVDVTLGSRREVPQGAVAYMLHGAALFRKQDFDGAIADYTKALTIDPEYAEVYNYRAATKLTKGDQVGGEADYVKYKELSIKEANSTGAPPAASSQPSSRRVMGLEVAALNDDLRSKFAIKPEVKGTIVVTAVDAGVFPAGSKYSPAVGDVIVSVANQPVGTPDDFQKIVDDMLRQGRKVAVLELSNANGEIRFGRMDIK